MSYEATAKKMELSEQLTSQIDIIPISFKKLLLLYSVIPISALLIFIDQVFFFGSLQRNLPQSPEYLIWFTIFFVQPHVIASSMQFLDTNYLKSYRKKLLIALPIIIAGSYLVPKLIGMNVFMVLFGAYTVYHAIGQQFGITRMQLKKVDRNYHLWKWTGIFIASLIYTAIYPPQLEKIDLVPILLSIGGLMFVPWMNFAGKLIQDTRNEEGVNAIIANQTMILFSLVAMFSGYPFFAVLAPRIIHDLTAYSFYITHDYNRNKMESKNWIFKITNKLKIPIFIATPLISVIIAFPITYYQEVSSIALYFVICTSIVHYYTEQLVWRKDTLHRAHIKII